jgi:hypothetical protein
MKSHLFAAAIAVAGFVLPAQASTTVDKLFDAIKATGTNIAVDIPRVCNDKDMLGLYEYQRNVVDQLTICVANHHGDDAAVFDTLLHESVHVAQQCYGGALFKPQSVWKDATYNELKTVQTFYPTDQRDTELEARVIARQNDEVYVTNLITQHCK